MRRLTLNWNTHAICLPFGVNPEHNVVDAEQELHRRGLIVSGDKLIILSDVMFAEERFDSIQIRTVL
jgi:pyruvate kinase